MPWGRLDDSLYDHPKLDHLPVERRLEGIGLWCRAISWANRFLTDGLVPRGRIAKLDGDLELADLLVGAGLFDEDPSGYRIHDFLEFNDSRADVEERRQKEAQRKAEWRAKKRPGGTDSGTNGAATHDVPQGQPTGHDSDVSRRDTRARARSANPDPARPGPTRPGPESLERGSARTGEREDIAALRDRGWKRITKAQRAILDEVLDRHDVTGAAFAAEVIRNTAADSDPLEAVMDADRQWQAIQRRRADAEESQAKADKAQERSEAETRIAELAAWR
jgi:hypothetical protein